MKKKLTVILLLCSFCLAICACSMNVFEVNQDDSTETHTDHLLNEDDQEDSAEMHTDHLLNEVVKPQEGERPLLTLESEDAYTKFLDSVEMPADFVPCDKIDVIGAFNGLVFLSDAYANDYSSYMYTLVDSEGFEITLYVDHRDEVLSTVSSVSKVNKTNMRLLSDTSRGVYVYNGIEYKYVSGELLSVSWKTQNITYRLCASGTPMLSDYPLTTSTFVGKMLNVETALQAFDIINQDENHNVPYSISFSSIAEMKDFLNSTKGNIAQYEEFIQDHNINTSITQSYAQKIATNVELNDVPLVKSNWVVDEFAATYYLDRNELDIIYKVNGIRYRFVYKYNGTSSVDRTTAPIFEDLKLGTYVVDLYQGDECFVGEVVTDFVVIQIVIYTERSNDVALNIFNMETLLNSVDK